MKKQNMEDADDSLRSADDEFDHQLNAIFGEDDSVAEKGEDHSPSNLVLLAARSDSPRKAFSWVMQSAVYDVKDSLAFLQCLLDQKSLQSSLDVQSERQASRDETRVMQRELSRIDGDISQLLTLYRMETDNLALHIEEVDLGSYLAELVLGNRLLFDLHGIEVEVEVKDDQELMGFFDPFKVKTVLQSIITAAIKYTQSKLVVRAQYNSNFLQITIMDDGAGYPAELLTDFSEPLATDADSDSNDGGKANLNTYFASRIAELHKNNSDVGFIQIENIEPESSNGGGSFSLFLPK